MLVFKMKLETWKSAKEGINHDVSKKEKLYYQQLIFCILLKQHKKFVWDTIRLWYLTGSEGSGFWKSKLAGVTLGEETSLLEIAGLSCNIVSHWDSGGDIGLARFNVLPSGKSAANGSPSSVICSIFQSFDPYTKLLDVLVILKWFCIYDKHYKKKIILTFPHFQFFKFHIILLVHAIYIYVLFPTMNCIYVVYIFLSWNNYRVLLCYVIQRIAWSDKFSITCTR